MGKRNIARDHALANGDLTYLNKTPCPHGHFERHVADYKCIQCKKTLYKQWKSKKKLSDPEGFKARHAGCIRRYRAKYPEKDIDRYAKAKPKRDSAYWLKLRTRSHGLTVNQFLDMFHATEQRCWICQKLCAINGTRHICIDHDHNTNAVRGLLCQICNTSIGQFKDDPVLLRRAAEYLELGIDWRTFDGQKPHQENRISETT